MHKNEIEEIFINGDYKNISIDILKKELKIYIRNKPLYINEIRNFLKEHDQNLFIEYGLCFKYNPGVTCAFGIEHDTSKVDLQTTHIKMFKTFKPIYKLDKDIKKDTKAKLHVKKTSKKDQIKRFKSKKEERELNDKKIEDIKKKLKN